MHAFKTLIAAASFLTFAPTVSLPVLSSFFPSATMIARHPASMVKCCPYGHFFNENLECTEDTRHREITNAIKINRTKNVDTLKKPQSNLAYVIFFPSCEYCAETTINGEEVFVRCSSCLYSLMAKKPSTRMTITSTTITTTTRTTTGKKDGVTKLTENDTRVSTDLTMVVFWGAQTYMITNIAHAILCIVVVVAYLSIQELGKGVYNRAVLWHNVCLLTFGCLLTLLGYIDLCECKIDDSFVIFLWLLLQYFTVTTVFWLNVICFDMTLCITRFRWAFDTANKDKHQENRRLLVYGVYVWLGGCVPSGVAAVFEYVPGVPEDSIMKPNYVRYRMGPNPTVNLYFFAVPLFTLFLNNVLFVFTTCKIIRMRHNTKIATRNHNNVLHKKYMLFLRLYLLMGAPWFFGLLFACLNKLVVLKLCRLIQPVLWLMMLFTHKKLRRRLADRLALCKPKSHPKAVDVAKEDPPCR